MIKDRIRSLGLELPPLPAPRGLYRSVSVHNGVAYVAGQLCRDGSSVVTGPVNEGTDPVRVGHAARLCVLRALSAIEGEVGLERVAEILFVRGFVFSDPGFQDHSRVVDEASKLIIEIFGDAGRHARSAVGVASLPAGGMLELELVAALS